MPSLFTAGISERRGAGAGDLLDHDARRDRVGARTAVLLRDVHGVEPGPHQRVEHVVGELGGLVDLGRSRRDLVVGELPGPPARSMPVLVGEPVLVEIGIAECHDPIVGRPSNCALPVACRRPLPS